MRRGANIFALLWSVGIAAFLLVVPMYSGASSTRTIENGGTVTKMTDRGLSGIDLHIGWTALIPMAVPILLALLPLLLRNPRARRRALAAAAIITGVLVVLGAASIGLFYLPGAIALAVAFGHSLPQPKPASQL
jgi:hypothetical protein